VDLQVGEFNVCMVEVEVKSRQLGKPDKKDEIIYCVSDSRNSMDNGTPSIQRKYYHTNHVRFTG